MRVVGFIAAGLFAFAVTAAAATPERVRGKILLVTPYNLTVKTNDGKIEKIALTLGTSYAVAAPATRADVTSGRYIGAATKTVDGRLVALEVTIFAPSMTGAGEGHYDWDSIPDTTATGAGEVPSGMTDGKVTYPVLTRMTHSSMTNGSVAAAKSLPGPVAAAGDRQILVTYKGGAQTVLLPPTAPINAVQPADRSALAKGAAVFVVAEPGAGGLTADYVLVATGAARLAM
jgi:hypothetical protein